MPFRPGPFAWGPGQPKPASVVDTLLTPVRGVDRSPTDVLTRPKDPFRFVVKSNIPASVPAVKHEADAVGLADGQDPAQDQAAGMRPR